MYLSSAGRGACLCSALSRAHEGWGLCTYVCTSSACCKGHASLCAALFVLAARFEDIHRQLVPYFLTIGSFAIEHGTSAIRPLAKHDSWPDKVRTTGTLELLCACGDRLAAYKCNVLHCLHAHHTWIARFNLHTISPRGRHVYVVEGRGISSSASVL